MNHYRCHRVWITKTRAEHVADTLAWFPSKIPMPTASSTDRALAAARDLVCALRNPAPASPFTPLDANQHQALTQLTELFASVSAPASPVTAPARAPPVPTPVPAPTPAQVALPFPLSQPSMPPHFRGCPPLRRHLRGCPPRQPITLEPEIPAAAVAKRASPRQPNPSSGSSTQHPHPTLSCPSLRQRSCQPRNRRLFRVSPPTHRSRCSRLDSSRG
jgi:hypothetical protein